MDHFSRPFRQPQVVNLPIPIEVAIDAKLGEPNGNDEEAYVPLVAIAVRPSST